MFNMPRYLATTFLESHHPEMHYSLRSPTPLAREDKTAQAKIWDLSSRRTEQGAGEESLALQRYTCFSSLRASVALASSATARCND